jgi:hypothetical protein
MQKFVYEEVKSGAVDIAAAQPDAQLVIAGNNAYNELKGYMIVITKADGTPFVGKATVGLVTSTGIVLLPNQPYHCVRPSFQEKHEDRIIQVDNIKGFGQDFRFRAEVSGLVDESVTLNVVAYFTRRKN